jgi:hypothetical protein
VSGYACLVMRVWVSQGAHAYYVTHVSQGAGAKILLEFLQGYNLGNIVIDAEDAKVSLLYPYPPPPSLPASLSLSPSLPLCLSACLSASVEEVRMLFGLLLWCSVRI